jgi:hypothetical protein
LAGRRNPVLGMLPPDQVRGRNDGWERAGKILPVKIHEKKQIDPNFFLEHKGSLKGKTSITVSQELLEDIDARARQSQRNRSEFIETALRI